jgi:branched-chain amino acid transport system substrate-binding protein
MGIGSNRNTKTYSPDGIQADKVFHTMSDDRSGSRRQFLKYVGVGAAATGLAGCTSGPSGTPTDSGGSGGSGGSSGGSGGGSGSVSLTIGGLFPTSGPYSSIGVDQSVGAETALDLASEDGVEVDAEIVEKDTELNPQTALRRAKELVEQENVDVLTGHASSSAAAAVSNYAKQQQIPHMLTVATDEALTAKDCHNYLFRSNTHTYQNMKPTAEWAMENLGTKFATMGADYSWGRASVAAFVEVAEANGGEVVEQTWPKLGATDYSSQIQKVADTDADFLLVRASGADGVNSTKQIDSFGLKDQMDVISNMTHNVALGAGEAAIGNYGGFPYHFALENEANQRFVETYRELGDDSYPSTYSDSSYVGVRMLLKAAAQAGSTNADDLVNALEGIEYDGPKGVMKIRECDHQSTNAVWTAQMKESDEYDFPVPEPIKKHEPGSNDRPCEETGCEM